MDAYCCTECTQICAEINGLIDNSRVVREIDFLLNDSRGVDAFQSSIENQLTKKPSCHEHESYNLWFIELFRVLDYWAVEPVKIEILVKKWSNECHYLWTTNQQITFKDVLSSVIQPISYEYEQVILRVASLDHLQELLKMPVATHGIFNTSIVRTVLPSFRPFIGIDTDPDVILSSRADTEIVDPLYSLLKRIFPEFDCSRKLAWAGGMFSRYVRNPLGNPDYQYLVDYVNNEQSLDIFLAFGEYYNFLKYNCNLLDSVMESDVRTQLESIGWTKIYEVDSCYALDGIYRTRLSSGEFVKLVLTNKQTISEIINEFDFPMCKIYKWPRRNYIHFNLTNILPIHRVLHKGNGDMIYFPPPLPRLANLPNLNIYNCVVCDRPLWSYKSIRFLKYSLKDYFYYDLKDMEKIIKDFKKICTCQLVVVDFFEGYRNFCRKKQTDCLD